MEVTETRLALTKHLKAEKSQVPFYTGGSLHFSQSQDVVYALCNFAVVVYNLAQGTVKQTISQVPIPW